MKLTAYSAKNLVARRLAGQPVYAIAKDMKISMATVYNVLNGKVYGQATKALRFQGKSILKELRQQHLKPMIDYRINHDTKRLLGKLAFDCIIQAKEEREIAREKINMLYERADKIKALKNRI